MVAFNNIKTFDWLDEVAASNRITDTEWAANCEQTEKRKISGSRISEWRRLSKNARANTPEKVGRAWTLERFLVLLQALIKILGENRVRADLTRILKKAEITDLERNILLILSMSKSQQRGATVVLSTILSGGKSLQAFDDPHPPDDTGGDSDDG